MPNQTPTDGWYELFDGVDSPYELNLGMGVGDTVVAESGYPDLRVCAIKELPLERLVFQMLAADADYEGETRRVTIARVVGVTHDGQEIEIMRQARPSDEVEGERQDGGKCAACGWPIPYGEGVVTEEGLCHKQCAE